MKTYWDSFLDDYELELRYLSIRIALEAFYYYCNNEKDKCDEFMKRSIYE